MFNRINQILLRYIDRKRGTPRIEAVEVARDGFTIIWQAQTDRPTETVHRAWGEIHRVVAMLAPGLVGGEECLLIEVGGSALQLTAEVAGFEAFIDEAAKWLDGWRRVAEWRSALAAAAPGQVVEVYGQRSGRP
jgi:hypothetical protein